MEMPTVMDCDATECAYNSGNMCHATAITIGGEADHRCDTFCQSSAKGGDLQVTGSVGACKVAGCGHNQNLECAAPGVHVGHAGGQVDCLTFSPT